MKDLTGIEYKIFPDTFLVMKLLGFWRPTTLKPRLLRWLYGLYSIFTCINISLLLIEILAYMATTKENTLDAFSQNWYLAAIVIHTLYVGLNVKIKRRKILNLLQTKVMVKRWMNVRDSVEIKIIKASDQKEQNMLRYWLSIVVANCTMTIFNPLISDNPDHELIYKTWKPCDTRVSSCFWICWISQAITFMYGGVTHVACFCIALNLIERVCSHVRILQHRLTKLPDLVTTGMLDTAEKERIYLVECILDHQNIYSTAEGISKIFSATVTLYFILNFSIICTNIYFLSEQPLFSNSFIAVCFFLCCMLMQALIQCWCGYKLKQINYDISYTIFSMNWLELRRDSRTTLRFIMLSASKSIPLFDNFIVELSPETFLRIIKLSYSAFNLLKTRK